MLSGQHLRLLLGLLCHCAEGACPCWTCHGQSLAGALLWASHCRITVRCFDHSHPTLLSPTHFTLCRQEGGGGSKGFPALKSAGW